MKPNFNKVAAEHSLDLIEDERGAPENQGTDFTASQYVHSWAFTAKRKAYTRLLVQLFVLIL
jgi:hypothetical protein